MRFLSLAFLAIILTGAVSAAESSRFALVIGNSAYEGDAALANPANDASDVAASLTSIGWTVTKIINADRKTMNRSISELRNAMSATEAPTALLYYAGHGVQINGTNYLIPVREEFETSDDVRNEAVSLDSILGMFGEAGVMTQIVILDACRDNPFEKKATRSLGSASRGLSVVSKSTDAAGSVVMFATAPGQTAADGNGRNGVFTQALLKYLKTDLKLQDMVTRITGEVKSLTNGQQTPYNSISLSDDFYMVPVSMRTTKSAEPMVITTAAVMIPFVVNNVPDGLEVWINNKRVGATPYETTVDSRIPFIVELKGEDWETYKVNIDPVGEDRVYLAPSISHSAAFTIRDLTQQRETWTQRAATVRSTGWGSSLLVGLGLVGSLAGGGAVGYSWYLADKAVAAYQKADSFRGLSAARADATAANQLFKIGLGVLGGGLGVWILGLATTPSTADIDSQIESLDRELDYWKRSSL